MAFLAGARNQRRPARGAPQGRRVKQHERVLRVGLRVPEGLVPTRRVATKKAIRQCEAHWNLRYILRLPRISLVFRHTQTDLVNLFSSRERVEEAIEKTD